MQTMIPLNRNRRKVWLHTRQATSATKWHLVCDVDGVITDGKFHYSSEGKQLKIFGSHDADALKANSFFDEITFVSADERGFQISSKRVNDMGFELCLRSPSERLQLIRELMVAANVIFIGDSFSDIPALVEATLSAAPKASYPSARKAADIKLRLRGGEGALAELLHLFN